MLDEGFPRSNENQLSAKDYFHKDTKFRNRKLGSCSALLPIKCTCIFGGMSINMLISLGGAVPYWGKIGLAHETDLLSCLDMKQAGTSCDKLTSGL